MRLTRQSRPRCLVVEVTPGGKTQSPSVFFRDRWSVVPRPSRNETSRTESEDWLNRRVTSGPSGLLSCSPDLLPDCHPAGHDAELWLYLCLRYPPKWIVLWETAGLRKEPRRKGQAVFRHSVRGQPRSSQRVTGWTKETDFWPHSHCCNLRQGVSPRTDQQ